MDFPISLDLAFEDPIASIYRFRSLLVVQWHDTPKVGRLASVTSALVGAVRQQAGNLVLCALVEAGRPLPDSAARAALQTGIERMGIVRGVVAVIRGAGFQAAATRAVMSGVSLVARPKYPVTFVGTEAEAAAFVTAKWPTSDRPVPDRLSLAEALARVRPKMG